MTTSTGNAMSAEKLSRERIERWRVDLLDGNEDPSDEYIASANALCDFALAALAHEQAGGCIYTKADMEAACALVLAGFRSKPVLDKMVDRFLAWPLPDSVCADLVATRQGYPHRIGTNLLNAIEAYAMLEHVLATPPARLPPTIYPQLHRIPEGSNPMRLVTA